MLGLAVIPYYISIRNFLNSWPINYDRWSYMISIGLGYLDSQVVLTKFVIYIALLSISCIILNHTAKGSIIVTAFRFKFYFYPFLCMMQDPIRYTQSLFHGIYSVSLAVNLTYFIFYSFVHWEVSQCFTSFWAAFIMPGQCKYWKKPLPLYPFLDEVDTYGTNLICIYGELTEWQFYPNRW